MWTSNLCVKKKIFERFNGLDERFEVAYEDIDFAYRLKKAGTPTRFVHEASVCHPWRSVRQGGKNWKVRNYESADLGRFLEKHHPKEREYSLAGFARNVARMLTSDLRTCIFSYKCRGIDILFFQVAVTIQSMFLILRHRRKRST